MKNNGIGGYIAFDELPDEDWAIAGKLLDEE